MAAAINLINSLNWQDPSKFQVHITGAGAEKANFSSVHPTILTAAVTSITLAEINTSPVEEYIGEEWRFATGRLENYLLTITMKDYDNFKIYKLWANAIQNFAREYPDDQKINVEVKTAQDFDINNLVRILEFKDCILTTVSGPTLDNSAVASIAEFSVTLKCSYINL